MENTFIIKSFEKSQFLIQMFKEKNFHKYIETVLRIFLKFLRNYNTVKIE
jgi:hypothetical protein